MDSILVDIICIGSGLVSGLLVKYKQYKRPIRVDDGTIPYVRWVSAKKQDCLECPKCKYGTSVAKTHPKFCECSEYHLGHYHFKCKTCQYEAIMRTNGK